MDLSTRLPKVNSVYVRAPNWVGDMVMATAAFARIRQGFPDARIVCGLRPYLRPLLSGNPWFDDYMEMPKAGGLAGVWRQARLLAAQDPGLAIVLPNSFETGLVPFLARVPLRVGYRQGRWGLMNIGLTAARNRKRLQRHGPRRLPKPMPSYYRDLLDLLALPPGPENPQLHVTDAEREFVDAWLAERGLASDAPLVLLNAGAAFGASKMWLPERFAEVARHYDNQGLVPILLSGPAEVAMVNQIAEQCGAVAVTDPVIGLDKLKALVARARLMVTTDTGPRHIAVALGVPVVCVMGPTDRRYTDYALEQQVVIQRDLPCVPCHRKTCPLGHHDCMKHITVDEVLSAADRWARP